MREAAKEPGLSPDRLFGVVFSFRHLKMILGLEFSWLGHVWGVGASERQLGDALGYGARKINPLAWRPTYPWSASPGAWHSGTLRRGGGRAFPSPVKLREAIAFQTLLTGPQAMVSALAPQYCCDFPKLKETERLGHF